MVFSNRSKNRAAGVRFTVTHKFDPVVSGIGGIKRLRPLRCSSAEVLQSARRAVLFY